MPTKSRTSSEYGIMHRCIHENPRRYLTKIQEYTHAIYNILINAGFSFDWLVDPEDLPGIIYRDFIQHASEIHKIRMNVMRRFLGKYPTTQLVDGYLKSPESIARKLKISTMRERERGREGD